MPCIYEEYALELHYILFSYIVAHPSQLRDLGHFEYQQKGSVLI